MVTFVGACMMFKQSQNVWVCPGVLQPKNIDGLVSNLCP